ncbi:hypothetical protein ACHAPV_009806 [Trichoderma viride]
MAPVVYIHGHFGECNLFLAKELWKMIPQTKVINDGKNVGLAKTIAQTSKEYQSLRAAMRRKTLHPIWKSDAGSKTTWIIVDEIDSKENKGALAADYEFAAVMGHSPLISIIIKFDLKLAYKVARDGTKKSPPDSAKAQEIAEMISKCENEEVFHLRNSYELELDVTMMSPTTAAEKIRDHIRVVQRMLLVKDKHSHVQIY